MTEWTKEKLDELIDADAPPFNIDDIDPDTAYRWGQYRLRSAILAAQNNVCECGSAWEGHMNCPNCGQRLWSPKTGEGARDD